MALDRQTRAEWLSNVADRVSSPEVAKLLRKYASEVLQDEQSHALERHVKAFRRGKRLLNG